MRKNTKTLLLVLTGAAVVGGIVYFATKKPALPQNTGSAATPGTNPTQTPGG